MMNAVTTCKPSVCGVCQCFLCYQTGCWFVEFLNYLIKLIVQNLDGRMQQMGGAAFHTENSVNFSQAVSASALRRVKVPRGNVLHAEYG